MNTKLFSFDIYEQNGEQEYCHTEYVVAENIDEANKSAYEYAESFYEDGESSGENQWSIEVSYSYIYWNLGTVREISQIVIYPINSGKLLFEVSNAIEDLE